MPTKLFTESIVLFIARPFCTCDLPQLAMSGPEEVVEALREAGMYSEAMLLDEALLAVPTAVSRSNIRCHGESARRMAGPLALHPRVMREVRELLRDMQFGATAEMRKELVAIVTEVTVAAWEIAQQLEEARDGRRPWEVAVGSLTLVLAESL